MWTHSLFMFDFDGLLVDSELLHYKAYLLMCRGRGVELSWDFGAYCRMAHYGADHLRRELLRAYPSLRAEAWEALYDEKSRLLHRLFAEEGVALMPGAEALLGRLQRAGLDHCVVTHSQLATVTPLRRRHRCLETIPFWITREDYTTPKPDPECYRVAMTRSKRQATECIGFEDTPRGMEALLGSGAAAVLICTIPYPEIATFLARGASHYHSLEEFDRNASTC